MMKCKRCRQKAEVQIRHHNAAFCRPCFVFFFRRQVERAIEKQRMFTNDEEILVEQFVKGREIQVGILDDRALGAIEIVPKKEFYDFEAKYTAGMAEHILPAPLPGPLYRKVLDAGERAHRCLGCSCYSRVDFLVTESGDCYLLEVNTLPGMTETSLLPKAAAAAGIAYADLCERMVSLAWARK